MEWQLFKSEAKGNVKALGIILYIIRKPKSKIASLFTQKFLTRLPPRPIFFFLKKLRPIFWHGFSGYEQMFLLSCTYSSESRQHH